MSENYQNWIDRIAGGRDAKPLNAGEVVQAPAAEPFGVINFAKAEKKGFNVEVGKKGDVYVYHFYPTKKEGFFEKMEESLLQVFKNPEQIEAAWVDEMKSFAVRVRGWVHTIWGDDLAIRVIDVLEEKLGA